MRAIALLMAVSLGSAAAQCPGWSASTDDIVGPESLLRFAQAVALGSADESDVYRIAGGVLDHLAACEAEPQAGPGFTSLACPGSTRRSTLRLEVAETGFVRRSSYRIVAILAAKPGDITGIEEDQAGRITIEIAFGLDDTRGFKYCTALVQTDYHRSDALATSVERGDSFVVGGALTIQRDRQLWTQSVVIPQSRGEDVRWMSRMLPPRILETAPLEDAQVSLSRKLDTTVRRLR